MTSSKYGSMCKWNINVHYHLFEDLRSLNKVIENKADGDKFRSALCNIGMITSSSKILSQDKGHFANLAMIATATIEVKSIVNVVQFLELLASFNGKKEDGHMVLEFNHLERVPFQMSHVYINLVGKWSLGNNHITSDSIAPTLLNWNDKLGVENGHLVDKSKNTRQWDPRGLCCGLQNIARHVINFGVLIGCYVTLNCSGFSFLINLEGKVVLRSE
ncbi:hypothetical protein PIB30_006110 [Stylosanthes scabra]|uniref:Uncharacterized protein n=1 Tax=Stylosanthes scabra TaxID=79078 RepID=A0ABU6W7D5_9FABA|nr:hypothetical protein [Stylosanthes scabra]